MPLTAAQTGGRIPAPIRVTIPVFNGTLGQPARGFEPGAAGASPALGRAISLLMKDSWTNPAAKAVGDFINTGITGASQPNNSTVTSTRDGTAAVWDGTLGLTGILAFERNLIVTVTNGGAGVVASSGTITGLDQYGRTITETWSVTVGGASKTYVTVTAFYRVDSITITASTDASGNTLKLGMGDVLGLAMPNPLASAVKEVSGGSVVTNGTFVAASTAANADKDGTYAPNTIPNGATSYSVWYICDDPTQL